MLTSNDYKELAARCTELASESSEPTVAEALRALASDYLARAAKLHFVSPVSSAAAWYGRSPAQVIRDEHVRICATNPRAPCHRRNARSARVR